jgi:hypothetical protein
MLRVLRCALPEYRFTGWDARTVTSLAMRGLVLVVGDTAIATEAGRTALKGGGK